LAIASLEGRSPADAARDIEAIVGDPYRASLIASTEMARANAAATLDQYRDMEVSHVGWETSNSDSVCDECAGYEGQIFPIDEAPECPAHPNCGCQLTPEVIANIDVTGVLDEAPDDGGGISAEDAAIGAGVEVNQPDDHANVAVEPELFGEAEALEPTPQPVHPVVPRKKKAMQADIVKVYRNAIDRAIDKLNELETDDEGRIRVPWQIKERPKIPTDAWADANLRSFEIEMLYATQHWIHRDTVQWHLEHLNDSAHDNKAMPNILIDNDNFLIYDGHHRLTALWLLGADSANCWTLEN